MQETQGTQIAENGIQRRGRYQRRSLEEKARIVARCAEPGTSVAAVALAHGVNANLLRKWIERAHQGPQPRTAFLPVQVSPPARTVSASPGEHDGLIDIELAGARITLRGRVDPAVVSALIAGLRR